ncbi:FAD-binding protein [Polymorphobacter arshaanensis]|uniref:FAD-binding protein n=1 Tax=Glacieibacterium arshaanense TaxID=2511025 RepID=A0A4Y9EK53_9SPHN|nr:FAD-binding protein [Polymorphobacter arshaanensis]TFU01162.1 FAD-binding protein [Polymorphobacter arshaanensis]
MTRLAPTSVEEIADMVRDVRALGTKLRIRGGDTRHRTGLVEEHSAVLDLSGLDRIIAYEPDELVLTAEAGVRLETVVALLATRGQHLAFEPAARAGSTLGGAIAANIAGPRRLVAGAVRDHFLGFEAVNGRGIRFRAGGRVVKNVTGFDLPKLLAGSWGSLAALTTVTVKVMPAPATVLTLALDGLDDARGVAALCRACSTAAEVSGAAHIPGGATLLRLEGFAPSVAARATLLDAALSGFGNLRRLDDDEGRAVWRTLTDAEDDAASQWRLTVPPTAAAATVAALAAKHDVQARYDWAGGLVLLSVAADGAAVAPDIHALAKAAGGSAMLLRDRAGAAPCAMFAAQPAPLAALSVRVRAAFDPDGVFTDRMAGN